MKQSYMNMSMNDIIKLVEKKDKKIAELEKKLLEVNENIKILGRGNRKLKKNNERYQERLTEVLYKNKIKNCSTCKNNIEFPPPHTCDICTSLDQEEEYGMWEAKRMRLIDADLLEDYIRGNIPLDLQEKFILAVEDQPTAYDVEHVIEEVKESYDACNENCRFLISYECDTVNCQIREIIDIIKRGGIKDE